MSERGVDTFSSSFLINLRYLSSIIDFQYDLDSKEIILFKNDITSWIRIYLVGKMFKHVCKNPWNSTLIMW